MEVVGKACKERRNLVFRLDTLGFGCIVMRLIQEQRQKLMGQKWSAWEGERWQDPWHGWRDWPGIEVEYSFHCNMKEHNKLSAHRARLVHLEGERRKFPSVVLQLPCTIWGMETMGRIHGRGCLERKKKMRNTHFRKRENKHWDRCRRNGKWLLEICGNKFKVRPDNIVLKVSLVNIQLLRFRGGISRV